MNYFLKFIYNMIIVRVKSLLKILYLGFLLFSCTEIFEPQIDNEAIEILVPRDSLTTEISSQLFFWYHIEDAVYYEFQIATPSFKKIDRLVVDTVTENNKLEFSLQPGKYEWRLRGFNFSSETNFTVRTLVIDSSADLTKQKLLLVAPGNDDTLSMLNVKFQWQKLAGATQYELLTGSPDFSGITKSFPVIGNEKSVVLADEGTYAWRVKAQNPKSQVNSETRSFFIDTTRPLAPTLISPNDEHKIIEFPQKFVWSHNSTGGSSLRDSFFVARDSNFLDLVLSRFVNNSEVNLDTISSGTYFWSVIAKDKAGNTSTRSNIRSFSY